MLLTCSYCDVEGSSDMKMLQDVVFITVGNGFGCNDGDINSRKT